MRAELMLIAHNHLGFKTLETRNMDRLDFRDCHVENVKQALQAAYEAGYAAAKKEEK